MDPTEGDQKALRQKRETDRGEARETEEREEREKANKEAMLLA